MYLHMVRSDLFRSICLWGCSKKRFFQYEVPRKAVMTMFLARIVNAPWKVQWAFLLQVEQQ